MEGNVIDLTAVLRDELAANNLAAQAAFTDPRTVPVRFSTLKMFAQSPAHYLHAVRRGYDETLSMRLGSGAHAILFGTPYAVWTGKTRNGNAWNAFEAEHSGMLILNQKELAEAQAMANAIRSHEIANRLLFTPGTETEKRIDWEWQGRKFRSTPDACNWSTLVDLKCLRSADPEKVQWQSLRMYYHAQAALYRMALNQIPGNHIKDCFLVVVENKAPHPVTVLRFKETVLEMGERSLALWMEQLRNCEESNRYPGYVQTIVDLELPGSDMDEFTFADDEEDK